MDVKFAINGIETLSCEIKPRTPELLTQQFDINVTTKIMLDEPKSLAPCIIEIEVWELGTKNALAKLSVLILYRIENFHDVFESKEGMFTTIPDGVFVLLSSIGISTVRGILYSLLKGTYLHKAIVPIMDMKTLRPDQQNINELSDSDVMTEKISE